MERLGQIKWAVWVIAAGVVVLVAALVVKPAIQEREDIEDTVFEYCIFNDDYETFEECEESVRFLIDVGLIDP